MTKKLVKIYDRKWGQKSMTKKMVKIYDQKNKGVFEMKYAVLSNLKEEKQLKVLLGQVRAGIVSNGFELDALAWEQRTV